MRKIRVLLVEDEAEKRQKIAQELEIFFADELQLETSETLSDAARMIFNAEFDLIVVDLLLPRRSGEEPIDVSEEIVDHCTNSSLNQLTAVVAISRFDDAINRRRDHFARANITIVKYSDNGDWKHCLLVCMQRVAAKTFCDFVIVCALGKERAAFDGVTDTEFSLGSLVSYAGLDCREICIGDFHGFCVLQPKMGLVDAAIIATKVLDTFSPRLICMSGICGGFKGSTELGRLIISDYSWEHQAGKWQGDIFELRSYHEHLNIDVRTALSQLAEEDRYLTCIAPKPSEQNLPMTRVELCPSVSGSAVIASDAYAEKIADQHGKVQAIDMEVYGLYRAASLFGKPVMCFAAKTVVDLAGEEKGDDLHKAGALLSARFVVLAIGRLLSLPN